MILTQMNYGPAHTIKDTASDAEKPWSKKWPFTKLVRWSDVVFLTWMSMTEGKPEQRKNLRWVQREVLQNNMTIEVMNTIARKDGHRSNCKLLTPGKLCTWQVPTWPGIKVDSGKDFQALLGTPNVHGVAYLLFQYVIARLQGVD